MKIFLPIFYFIFLILVPLFISFYVVDFFIPQYGDFFNTASTVFVVLGAFPAFYFFLKSTKNGRGSLALVLLTLFAFCIEYIGIKTGFPYGNFSYTNNLGPLLFDTLPVVLPFAWIPLVISAYTITHHVGIKSPVDRVVSMILLLLIFDLILDPAAVALEFWKYQEGGFYGVPLSNYLGWILSGFIGSLLLLLPIHYKKKRKSEKSSSQDTEGMSITKIKANTPISRYSLLGTYFSMIFFGVVALQKGLGIPLLISIVVCSVLFFMLTYSRKK